MYRVMALDVRYKLVLALYLWHFFTEFLQTLRELILGRSVLGLQNFSTCANVYVTLRKHCNSGPRCELLAQNLPRECLTGTLHVRNELTIYLWGFTTGPQNKPSRFEIMSVACTCRCKFRTRSVCLKQFVSFRK